MLRVLLQNVFTVSPSLLSAHGSVRSKGGRCWERYFLVYREERQYLRVLMSCVMVSA